jgi:hypothetical protein
MEHPIFGDMASELERKAKRDRIAAELKVLMEHQWARGPCAKARGLCRWVMPRRLGSSYGYHDDISHD